MADDRREDVSVRVDYEMLVEVHALLVEVEDQVFVEHVDKREDQQSQRIEERHYSTEDNARDEHAVDLQ